ncbi:MAG TPA: DNA translocase FtsK 4TM domain-containing protein [Myxococcota bacterium]|nr:DNA translocase FtsK 4TM domain-containing protein [Myxococcota bacterium]
MARASARAARGGAFAATLMGRLARESLGIALLGLAVLAAASVATYTPVDPVLRWVRVTNAGGVVGAALAGGLVRGIGWAAVVPVLALALVGSYLLVGRRVSAIPVRLWLGGLGLLLALATLPVLLHELARLRLGEVSGGALGSLLASLEGTLLSRWGALLVNFLLLTASLLAVTGIAASTALAAVAAAAAATGRGAVSVLRVAGRGLSQGALRARENVRAFQVWRERRARRARVEKMREPEGAGEPEGALAIVAAGPDPFSAAALRPAAERERPERRGKGTEPAIVDHSAERHEKVTPRQEAFLFAESRAGSPFLSPDISLFQKPPATARTYDRESLIMNSRILEKKLKDFGVGGRVVTVHPGPVVTMYEFEPESGVKVNRIVNLADDLSLALRALSVRIIAPLPGKSVVGIEVPNSEREIVYIRDLLESESFRASSSRLTLALGKDIFGNPVEADLARMPHLLVAGATGTGKSVFLNTLLCSILFRTTPDELKLLLVDPKLLELSMYEGIPHLIADVVTNPKRAAAALAGIVHKMEERYQMMAALGVRSIDQFNARVDEELRAGHTTFRLKPKPGETEGRELAFSRLPYIVVVIDELADLMVVSARDVEEALQRLAQMARAAGIHLVLATQRPSVDVLTGVIKANFPARLSFQVSSRTDSRTIMDQNGAEHLLGQGDMLFLPPGTSKLQRIHGAYVSEKEVSSLVAFLRDQGKPQFDETLLKMKEESEQKEERGSEVDEMYDRAIAIVAETRNASISYLQRRLKVGYNRAARMVEQMELDGIIGPQEGTKPREVYARSLDLE